MLTRTLALALLCLCFAAAREQAPATSAAAPQAASVPPDYRIGEGDVLQINVWKEPDASAPSVAVRPDGKISMPVIKEVEVVGLTPAELEKVLAERLGRFIHGAEVTVLVREVRSKKVYIVGAVRREGPLRLESPITILQALNEAGGLTEYARRKKIYVLRNSNGRPERLPFDYDAALKGERTDQNIVVQPGDTIVVP